jgi:P-type Ca2+ transporter type 2C
LPSRGKRLTAYAYLDGELNTGEPQGLVLVGAAIINDPIREEVPDAIAKLEGAGIRTVMITGDVPETALYIAKEVGLSAHHAVTGRELADFSDDEMDAAIQDKAVFARISPQQKYDLVRAFNRKGDVIAVTGDGINDAPALKAAHIGVAMGERGTDVARETADLVLTDDNFAHLPEGVAIGRKAYDNFRKGITYYLSAKAILLTIFILPLLFGLPFPLSPIQIIFTELLMDLASSTIFITESAEPDVMVRQPRKKKRFMSWIVGKRILRNMLGLSIIIMTVYFRSLALDYSVDSARTVAFATWLLGHIILALNLKQEKLPLLKEGLFSNRFAIGWLLGMIAFVLAMTQWPFARSVLDTTILTGLQWVLVVLGALAASMWMEIYKWIRLKQDK